VVRRGETRSPAPISQRQRLDLIRRLVIDDAIELPTRVAALLMLLYAQPLTRILRLTTGDVLDIDTEVTIRLGDPPSPVPEPVAGLLCSHNGDGHQCPPISPGGRSCLCPSTIVTSRSGRGYFTSSRGRNRWPCRLSVRKPLL
jgi:hypothetical protein